MRRLFLRNIVSTGRVFAMNDCGSVPVYTTKGEKPQRHEMCREMKQKMASSFAKATADKPAPGIAFRFQLC